VKSHNRYIQRRNKGKRERGWMRIISFCFRFWKEGREMSRRIEGDGGGEGDVKGNEMRDR